MRRFAVTVALVLVAACSSPENNDHSHSNNHDNHANHGTTGSNSHTGDVDEYADGMMKHGHEGNFMVMLQTADPAPPDVGDNTWTVRVMEMDDSPVDDAKVTLTPFMPAHGHGTSPADFNGTFTEDGTYEVGPFDLFMPGVWETTVAIDSGGTTDMVTFTFELEG